MAPLVLRPAVRSHSKPSRPLGLIPAVHLSVKKIPIISAASTSGNQEYNSNGEIKSALYQAVEGINRGIFGVTSAKKSGIWELVELLESRNPTPQPTNNLLEKRVDIKLEKSTITPDQLMNLFEKNYDILLAIFNPEGWLDITIRYVDDSLRIGRDVKGNIFDLEMSFDAKFSITEEQPSMKQ